MNIFVVDLNPITCAKALDDRRLNKMILETAQLLSTAMRECGYISNNLYKSTHVNHPCSIWSRQTHENFYWLTQYFKALADERKLRTGKDHASYIKIWPETHYGINFIPHGAQTAFANCTPYKNINTFDAYMLTLRDKWSKDKTPPKWTNTIKPSWA